MKNTIPIILVVSFLNIHCGNSKKETTVNIKNQTTEEVDEKSTSTGKEVAIISTDYGDLVVEFFEEVAPKHVESFKIHVNNGYYDGTIFHRVIPGFMIQGGDPNTKSENKGTYGMGGRAAKYYGIGEENEPSSWNLPAEFNDINHKRGILSMARSNNPNSGGSQFFICAADAPHLDKTYTVFGQIIEGDEVIDQIITLPRDTRDNPNRRVEMSIKLEKR